MNNKFESVLVINPHGVGDVFFSTPLLRNIREYAPGARIYYMCNKRVAPLLEANPLIYKLFVYERDDFERLRQKSFWSWLIGMMSFLNSIRREHIEVAFDLSLNTKFGFFCFYGGIKRRIGFDYKKRGKFLNYKMKLDGFSKKHAVEYYLDLLRVFKIPVSNFNLEYFVSERDKAWADKLFEKRGLEHKLIICVAPFGGKSYGPKAYIKRWPAERFSSLIDHIIEKYDAHVCILAGPSEVNELRILYSMISRKDQVFDTLQFTFSQSASVIEKSTMLIGNDTGAVHIANALGKKVVAFFGPVDEKIYGIYPFSKDRHKILSHDIPCRPCYKNFRLSECKKDLACLKDIQLDEVYLAIDELLKKEN